jgi:WD40 repeat protein
LVPAAGAAFGPGRSFSAELSGLIDLDKRKEKPRALADRHTAAINCVAFSPKGDLCVTGGDDTRIRLWSTTTGELLHTVAAHQNAVTSLQAHPPERPTRRPTRTPSPHHQNAGVQSGSGYPLNFGKYRSGLYFFASRSNASATTLKQIS